MYRYFIDLQEHSKNLRTVKKCQARFGQKTVFLALCLQSPVKIDGIQSYIPGWAVVTKQYQNPL